MTAQQELFTYFKTQLNAYDGQLPPKGTQYPFYYLADTRQQFGSAKSNDYGYVTLIVHIWHNNEKERGTLSEMMDNVMNVSGNLKETSNYKWSLIRNETEQQIMADNTTTPPLMHGWSSLRFSYSKKGQN